MLIKHLLILIVCSVLAVFFKNQLVHVLNGLLYLHNAIANGLSDVFSSDDLGKILQAVIALLIIPLIVGIAVSFIHWMMKHTYYPYTMQIIWIAWAVLLVAMLSQVVVSDDMSSSSSSASSSSHAVQKDGAPN